MRACDSFHGGGRHSPLIAAGKKTKGQARDLEWEGKRKEFETALVIVRANGINGEGVSERGRQGLRDVGTVSYFVSPPSQLCQLLLFRACYVKKRNHKINFLNRGLKQGQWGEERQFSLNLVKPIFNVTTVVWNAKLGGVPGLLEGLQDRLHWLGNGDIILIIQIPSRRAAIS